LEHNLFITTAIPYVNGRPHIGHAFEFVVADALARFHRLNGADVWFLTGSDDNSISNVRTAEREGIPVAELVERNTKRFQALKSGLSLSYDDFIRTSVDERHLLGVKKLWEACDASGDIYRKVYSGLYCVSCERFYKEGELDDGRCPQHLTEPELVDEENYFFRLTRYSDRLLELIESGDLEVIPDSRRNEVLGFIRGGLEDFSISRSARRSGGWGILVPGDPDQVMYVWFDALGNYITALDYANEGQLFRRHWIDDPDRVHVIGKDIIRFHAVFWPAMLLSAGIPLPRTIFVHGHIRIGGTRMSTTIGNVVDPLGLVRQYGTDAVRYFLLRLPATQDPDFTIERFVAAYNHDLADQLGNLVGRTTSMISSFSNSLVPASGPTGPSETSLRAESERTGSTFKEAMERYRIHEAVGAIWDLVSAANKYAVEAEPWALEATDPTLPTALYHLAESLRLIATFLEPLLPETSAEIERRLGWKRTQSWIESHGWGSPGVGTSVENGPPLFPKDEN
jgi:methionyl-tRNA synthetase